MNIQTTSSSVFSAPTPRIFSIDPGRPFLPDLARGLGAALGGGDPLALADAVILVPTRRAARALADAFTSLNDDGQDAVGRATLLPQIRPLGDIDEDAFAIFNGAPEDAIDLPPAVAPLERQLVLARLVAAKDKVFAGQADWAAAIGASQELAKLLDSFYTEEINFGALRNVAPAEHAAHWERSLKFLEIVTKNWPDHLCEIDRMDPTARRMALIDAQARRWAAAKPTHPIIIAGTTGSAPSVARLVKTVSALEQGLVILPGLDRALASETRHWDAVDDPHPQAGMKLLLEKLSADPRAVGVWPGSAPDDKEGPPRQSFLSMALRPAKATDDWRRLVTAATKADPGLAAATRGLCLIEAENEEAEAAAVAMVMRQVLETPGETAMLVTPDRNLARRTALKMRRWDVMIDDSAGIPLTNSLCGTYLRHVAEWLDDPSDPVTLLALARSPLARFGNSEDVHNKNVSALDKTLRGLRPAQGLPGLEKKIASHRSDKELQTAMSLLPVLETAYAPWSDILARGRDDRFADRIAAHIHAAETLAGDGEVSGAERLWRREDGAACALFLAELQMMAPPLDEEKAGEYAKIFTQILAGATIRNQRSAHPRISILGPLEARLQSADHVILGGLNEGVWPAEAAGDPFLSRPMRAEIGLPSPERRIGLSAHDFAQLASAPNVTLTRARKAGGKPAKPSRWLVRLQNILIGAKCKSVDRSNEYARFIDALNHAGAPVAASRPEPAPPVNVRPRGLFVTDIEKWLRDPYAIYAKHILRLRKLYPLGETFGPQHLGQLFHKVFEDFARNHFNLNGDVAVAQLHALFDAHAPSFGFTIAHRAFWRASVDDTFRWFTGYNDMSPGAPAVLEEKGSHALKCGCGEFAVTARADRIDLLDGGGAVIYDYKSKNVPSLKQAAKFSPQLALTGWIVENGGYKNLPPDVKVRGVHYVRVVDRLSPANRNWTSAENEDAAALIGETADGLVNLINIFDDPATPYYSQPRPEFTDDYGDYDHLARRAERGASGESGEGEE